MNRIIWPIRFENLRALFGRDLLFYVWEYEDKNSWMKMKVVFIKSEGPHTKVERQEQWYFFPSARHTMRPEKLEVRDGQLNVPRCDSERQLHTPRWLICICSLCRPGPHILVCVIIIADPGICAFELWITSRLTTVSDVLQFSWQHWDASYLTCGLHLNTGRSKQL